MGEAQVKAALGSWGDKLLLSVIYGNRQSAKDTDVLVVLDAVPPRKSVLRDGLDLSLVSLPDYEFRLSHWDHDYTEPILTGEFLMGDTALMEQSVRRLRDGKPDGEALRYLGMRAWESYFQAEGMLCQVLEQLIPPLYGQGKGAGDVSAFLSGKLPGLYHPLHQLGHSLSYLAFRERYRDFKGPVAFGEMLVSPQNALEALLAEERAYARKNDYHMEDAERYFRSAREALGWEK